MFRLILEKAEELDIKLPTSAGSWKKQESSRKTSISAVDYAKAFDCVDHNKLWKILRDGNTRPPYLLPEKSVAVMSAKKIMRETSVLLFLSYPGK